MVWFSVLSNGMFCHFKKWGYCYIIFLPMYRTALEASFGKEEGSRLDSQIILSRNHTKYTQVQ